MSKLNYFVSVDKLRVCLNMPDNLYDYLKDHHTRYDGTTNNRILDGKQRIEAIKKFKQNDLEYKGRIWRESRDIQEQFDATAKNRTKNNFRSVAHFYRLSRSRRLRSLRGLWMPLSLPSGCRLARMVCWRNRLLR